MRVVWINGWSLGESYVSVLALLRFPEHEHIVVNSVPGWDRAVEAMEEIDILIGYSMGAFLLLGRPDLYRRARRTILLAPFEDFRSESGCGGKVRRGQLSYLLKWMDRDVISAVADFRIRAGIDEPGSGEIGFSVEELKWGIEHLRTDSVDSGMIEKFECYLGSKDSLLDPVYFKNRYPGINIIEGAGHDLKELLDSEQVKL